MEIWLPVGDYEGLYEVSDWGRVKSLARTHAFRGSIRTVAERILKPGNAGGAMIVSLSRDGVCRTHKVHHLVLEAHVGPRPEGAIGRHWPDGDVSNNFLTNLQWDTQSQNMYDRREHGTDPMLSRTHCPQGHAYEGANIKWKKNGARDCRQCQRDRNRIYQRNRRARL